jgi:hypothetical protein
MIGIIGGYGGVGLHAARFFNQWGQCSLRIGGRNPETARLNFVREFPLAEWVKVDIEDDRSTAAFLDGCELAVNCAGPSYRTAARVARICLAQGRRLIDAGLDQTMGTLRTTSPGATILYAAGATPGLSGLLPRWLAKSFDQVATLLYYTGALDRFTATAAVDYLAGVSGPNNLPLAAWKDGARRLTALVKKPGTVLPFFPRAVNLYPYLDAEAEMVAAALALQDGEWYLAIDGERVAAALETIRPQFSDDPFGAVKRLCAATELEAAGRRRYQNFMIQLSGRKNGALVTRTLVLQAESPAVLTGTVAAAAGIAVLEGSIPSGVRTLAEIPDPDVLMDRLMQTKCLNNLAIFECPVAALLPTMEGEI